MSPPTGIRALVFDLGQVIVRVREERTAAAIARQARTSPEEIIRSVKNDELRHVFQEGRLSPEEWHRHLSGELGLRLSFPEFCDAWNSMLDREPMLEEKLFEELAGRYRLLILSNTDPIHVEWMEANLSVLQYFPERIYSCLVGVAKPGPGIYQIAIEKAGVEPEQIFYVDDALENVEAGRRAGLQAYQFCGACELVDELRTRRLLD